MSSQSSRILLADDDPEICTLLRIALVGEGYDVLIAHNGDQLVRMAQAETPDLLLVDLMMPRMDGFEAIRQLRNDSRTAHLPMIILTARGESQEVVTGFDSGADDYIVKPYDVDILLARIRGHLRRAAQIPVRNPLTGLPGNVLLQAEIERLVDQDKKFALLYVDLDNFKAFNDAYGFARGDRAIHLLANVLIEVAPQTDFLGHIGGDDFAIIHYRPDAEDLCKRMITSFHARVADLYDLKDVERGYLQGLDRQGVVRRFGLLSLSIAVVSSYTRTFASIDEISKVVAELKSRAKLIAGSTYEIDRRRTPMLPQLNDRRGRQRTSVLILTTDVAIQADLTEALSHIGYQSLIATDMLAAHTLLARAPDPAMIIADAMGQQSWRELLQHSKHTRLLLLTTEGAEVQIDDCGSEAICVAHNGNTAQTVATICRHLPHLISPDQANPKAFELD